MSGAERNAGRRPWFSVIVPFHNRGAHVRACLDSIARQSYQDFEVICVDDGSTDDTLQRLRAYTPLTGDAGATLQISLVEQANAGPGAARNAGAALARGRYLAFLDSDDRWLPWALQTCFDALRATGSPAFLAGKPEIVSAHDKAAQTGAPLRFNYFADFFSGSDAWRWFSASSFVIRRDAFERTGGFTDERVNGEDAELTMRLGIEPGFTQIVAPPTFCYLEHADSEVHNWERSLAGWHLQYQRERAAQFPGGTSRRRDRHRILTRASRSLSLALMARGRRRDAIEIYHQTFGWNLRLMRFRYLLGFWLRLVRR